MTAAANACTQCYEKKSGFKESVPYLNVRIRSRLSISWLFEKQHMHLDKYLKTLARQYKYGGIREHTPKWKMNAAVKTAVTKQRKGGVKAQQAKLHPKAVMCNLLITGRVRYDYWTAHEEQIISNNVTFSN